MSYMDLAEKMWRDIRKYKQCWQQKKRKLENLIK